MHTKLRSARNISSNISTVYNYPYTYSRLFVWLALLSCGIPAVFILLNRCCESLPKTLNWMHLGAFLYSATRY